MPPFWLEKGNTEYLLGTDHVGRDIFSNLLFGLRISLTVGFISTSLMFILGTILGLISGFYLRWIDTLIMRWADIQMVIPPILVALAVMGVFGAGLMKLVLIIAITGWPQFGRPVRGLALSLREKDFVESGKAIGVPTVYLMLRYFLPNILPTLIVLTVLQLPTVILLESTLSFLGVGVPVTTPSLGMMAKRGYQVLFSGAWWVSVFPGLVLIFLTIAMNLVGDWVRDKLDPRTQNV